MSSARRGAMSFSPLTFERYSRTSRQALCHLPAAAALRFWYGIAVLPCFSASRKVPVTRCGLPLRGTYAVYVQFPLRLSHAHARLRPRKHFKRFHQSRQGGRIPTRSFQQALSFSVRRSAYSHIIRELPGLWHGQLGIEPTAHGFGDRVATLVHLPVYVSPGSHRWEVRGVLSCGTASAWYAPLRGSLKSASYEAAQSCTCAWYSLSGACTWSLIQCLTGQRRGVTVARDKGRNVT